MDAVDANRLFETLQLEVTDELELEPAARAG
jgi:hypothetical protein